MLVYVFVFTLYNNNYDVILRVTFLFRGMRFCCGLYVVGAAKQLAALRPLINELVDYTIKVTKD